MAGERPLSGYHPGTVAPATGKGQGIQDGIPPESCRRDDFATFL